MCGCGRLLAATTREMPVGQGKGERRGRAYLAAGSCVAAYVRAAAPGLLQQRRTGAARASPARGEKTWAAVGSSGTAAMYCATTSRLLEHNTSGRAFTYLRHGKRSNAYGRRRRLRNGGSTQCRFGRSVLYSNRWTALTAGWAASGRVWRAVASRAGPCAQAGRVRFLNRTRAEATYMERAQATGGEVGWRKIGFGGCAYV